MFFGCFSDTVFLLFGYTHGTFSDTVFFFGRGLILALIFLLFGYTQKLFGYTPFFII